MIYNNVSNMMANIALYNSKNDTKIELCIFANEYYFEVRKKSLIRFKEGRLLCKGDSDFVSNYLKKKVKGL